MEIFMKQDAKTFFLILGLFVILIFILAGSFRYVTGNRYTEVDRKTSPDERCQLTLQMQGESEWPFGTTYGRIIARYDEKVIKKIKIAIRDDGAALYPENWSVEWVPAGAQITLWGSEQDKQVLQIMYDGSEEFSGYREAQITEELEKRYDIVKAYGKEGDLYCYDAGEFLFYAKNDLIISDNYGMECYRYLTDSYFMGRNRSHDYEESGSGIDRIYIPVISLNSSDSEEKEWFCKDIINWLLYVLQKLPYAGNECIYSTIEITYREESFTYCLKNLWALKEDDTADVYNDLYVFIEEKLDGAYRGKVSLDQEHDEAIETAEVTEETIQYYLSLKPDCSYEAADGVEYRMIPVDRAAGSSYYAFIVTVDGGKSAILVNTDPYLGSGGESRWVTFLEDGKTGFSCLAYSGGTRGRLYRTEDGGKSFIRVEYPSAKIKLPDGTYYNPFIMPERVYEEAGKLCMEAGQGPDGDYYGEEGFCNGLYESEDQGKTWRFVKEIAADRFSNDR